MRAGEAALAARLRVELEELERVVRRAEHLLAKTQTQGDEDYLDGVALNLHGFYAGVERIFEEIAVKLTAHCQPALNGIVTFSCKCRLKWPGHVRP